MDIAPYNPDVAQTGIIAGEPNAVYHANPAVSSTNLKDFSEHPRRFGARLRGEIPPQAATDALVFGELVHAVCLEPETIGERFYDKGQEPVRLTAAQEKAMWRIAHADKPSPADARKLAEYQAMVDASAHFLRENEGKQAVSVSELERAQAMRAALLENPDTAPLMSEADHAELTFRTPVNEKLGFALQCRADLFHLPKKGQPRRIVDIKTTRSLGAFRHQFATLGYYRSAAFYLWVVETILGPAPTHFTYLAIEKDPPYECAAFTPDEEAIRFGLDEVDRKTMELAACLREGRFPYQFPGMQTLSLPAWYMDKKLSEDQEVSAAYVTQHSGMWTDMGDDGDEAAG